MGQAALAAEANCVSTWQAAAPTPPPLSYSPVAVWPGTACSIARLGSLSVLGSTCCMHGHILKIIHSISVLILQIYSSRLQQQQQQQLKQVQRQQQQQRQLTVILKGF